MAKEQMRNIPSVEQILNLDSTAALLARYRRNYVVSLVRQVLERLRGQAMNGRLEASREELVERAASELTALVVRDSRSSMKRVINATGVVLHTGLGRAPLPPAALEAVARVAENYCNLEFDLERGKRGKRQDHVEQLICNATGAEAAAVVNNNAAAVLLMLNTLARGREVIISRGQLVEIGGSFRMPDVIAASGARIREVGTTNRTHLRDYAAALGTETAAVLVVHTSNYRVRGFTAEVSLRELAPLCREAEVPLIYDLGGGVLLDMEEWGLPPEPVVGDSLQAGAELVSFSGDKLLGGPQAGIIAGSREWMKRIVGNPLMRALRCDKMTLAALEATLRLYRLTSAELAQVHPALRMLEEPVAGLQERGERLLALLTEEVKARLRPELIPAQGEVGSGALPLEELPGMALALQPREMGVEKLARRLRLGEVAVVGRIWQERLLLDLRTIRDDEVEAVARALMQSIG